MSAEIEGDGRKPVVWSVDGSYESRPDGSWEGGLSFTFKPLPSLSIRIGPEFSRQLTAAQYVRTVTDPAVTAMYGKRYVFAAIDQTELVMDTRVNVMLSPKMSMRQRLHGEDELLVQPVAGARRLPSTPLTSV